MSHTWVNARSLLILLGFIVYASTAMAQTGSSVGIASGSDGASVNLDSIKNGLLHDVGAGLPVAVFASDKGVVAISADGSRTAVIVDRPATWAKVDAHSDVIWFGTEGKKNELWAVDLAAATKTFVHVATNIPKDVAFGIRYVKGSESIEGLFDRSSEYSGRFRLDLGGKTPRFSYSEGSLSVIDPAAAKRVGRTARLIRITPEGKLFLNMLGSRQTGKMALLAVSAKTLPRVVAVPKGGCEDEEMCGQAEQVPGTLLWRVIVGQSCGDGCYVDYQIYNSQSRVFVDLARPGRHDARPLQDVESINDAWISADGTSMIQEGSIYRFATGLVKKDLGFPAGWLDGEWHFQ